MYEYEKMTQFGKTSAAHICQEHPRCFCRSQRRRTNRWTGARSARLAVDNLRVAALRARPVNSTVMRLPFAGKSLLNLAAFGIVMA